MKVLPKRHYKTVTYAPSHTLIICVKRSPALDGLRAADIHFLNMVQWRKYKEKDIRNEPLHRWLVCFDQNSPAELKEEAASMDPAIMALNEKLELVMTDEEAQRVYLNRQMAEMDEIGRVRYAREEGLAEGLAQGREQSAIEIARKMKAAGLASTEIEKFTGLSTEAIEKL